MKTRKEWFHGRRFVTEVFDDGGGGGGGFEPVVIDIGNMYNYSDGDEVTFTGTIPEGPTSKLFLINATYTYQSEKRCFVGTGSRTTVKSSGTGYANDPILIIGFSLPDVNQTTDMRLIYDYTTQKMYINM